MPVNTNLLDGSSSSAAMGEAVLAAKDVLSAFAVDEDFATKVTLAFGDGFDAQKLESLRQQWISGEFDSLPTIEIRSSAEINGANGAFSADTNTIYLSREYIAQNAVDVQAIADVLLEEIGHSVDSHINVSDAPGDEGAIFSILAHGETLDEGKLQQLKAEDDSVNIILNNQVINIEQAIAPEQLCDEGSPYLRLLDERYPQKVFDRLKELGDRLQPLGEKSALLPTFGTPWANYDEYKITIPPNLLPSGFDPKAFLKTWPQNMNGVPQGEGAKTFKDINEFSTSQKALGIGDVIEISITGDDGDVMITELKDTYFRVSTLDTGFFGTYSNKTHPVSGSREFGFEQNSDGSVSFYTRGLDTPQNKFSQSIGVGKQREGWTSFMQGIGERFGLSPEQAKSNVMAFDNSIQERPDCHKPPQPLYQGNNLGETINGLDGLFDTLQTALNEQVFANQLPLLGTQLADSTQSATLSEQAFVQQALLLDNSLPDSAASAAQFLTSIKDEILNKLQEKLDGVQEKTPALIREALAEALGPDGLNLLQDDIQVIETADDVKFNLKLANTFTSLDADLDANIGLPGLGLNVDGNAKVDFGYEFNLNFGINTTDGFYFDTENPDELIIDLNVSVPDLKAEGTLGFLQVNIQDEDADSNSSNGGVDVDGDGVSPTNFKGKFTVDLKDTDNKLRLSEIPSVNFKDLIDAKLNGSANVNLNLVTNFNGVKGLPSLHSDFNLGWTFNDAEANPSQVQTFGSVPIVAFNNVELDLGSFFSDFAQPIIGEIQKVTQPFEPIINVLKTDLPVLDQFGVDINLLDIAKRYGANTDFIEALADFSNVVNAINTTSVGANTFIKLGSFNLQDNGVDVRESTDLTTVNLQNFTLPEINPLEQAKNQGGSAFFTEAGSVTGGGLKFPILENPTQAFNLFLGKKDVDLFTFQIPGMSAKAGGTFATIPVWPVPPVTISFGGNFGINVPGLTFGYDTQGLLDGKPFEGFFVDNRNNLPEFSLNAGLFADGNVGLPVLFNGGGRVRIEGIANFNLHDPTPADGKVRPQDIADNLSKGLDRIFDIDGGVYAGADLYIEHITLNPIKGLVGLVTGDFDKVVERNEWNIATIELFSFANSSSGSSSTPPPPPNVATSLGNGELRLNMGPFANVRNISKDVIDETFNITPGLVLAAFGVQETYTGINKVTADGGTGNDVISIDADVVANLHGGDGNDNLYGNSQDDQLFGDEGSDRLTGRGGNDTLTGGAGNDKLYGDQGNDLLQGEVGDDLLDGGADNDTLFGGAGNDQLSGGSGEDYLDGGTNNDQLSGGADNDTLLGGDGEDLLIGGAGNDSLDGGVGNDRLYGEDGNDTLKGGLGNDVLDGYDGNDELFGESGDDTLKAGAGDDTLIGGAGNDLIDGGDGIDTVSYENSPSGVVVNLDEGSSSDGFGTQDILQNLENIIGSQFDDTLIGNSQDNRIEGRAGNDRIFGENGNDTLLGEDGDDTLVGGAGTGWPSDILNGGAGNDTASYITATSGVAASLEQKLGWLGDATGDQFISIENLEGSNFDDFLIGDNGANILSGLAGNDTLEGRDGDDTLNGGEGNNILNAGEGNNTVTAGSGNDIVYAGSGNDTISTNGGNDEIYAGDGNNTIDAGDGTNKIYAGTGYDYISAGTGDDEIYVGNGGSTIFGGAGNNKVYAGTGYDSVYAEDGNDLISVGDGGSTIRAGNGKNTIYAGTGDDEVYTGTGDDEIHVGEGNNYINAGSGKNTISAGSGNDVIDTGAGDDTIYANEGLNTIRAGDGNNKIYSGSGGDFIFAGSGDDEIYAGEGQNYIDAGNGNNKIYSGASSDFILSGNGNDLIYAGEGNNRISAGNGNNTIYAGAGNDEISTGSGNDLIYAGEGNNLIATGTGFDTVYAGSGVDRFSLSEGLGAVTIIGFQASHDLFIGVGSLSFSISGNDTFVSLSSSDDLLAIVKDVQLV